MATEADIPETISVAKKEKGKELMSDCLNTTANEITLEGMNKVEPWHSETPETIKILEKSADMQVETKTEVENVNAVIEGNVETIEGEIFLGSPLVTKVAHEETSRVADDYQAAEKPTQAEKEVPKNETLREDKLENQHVEIVENKEASLEKFKQNTFEELRSSEKDEKGVAMTEEKTDSESHKKTLDMLEASSGQNAGALVQTPDLTEDENMDSGKLKEACDKEESIDNAFSTKTPSIEENKREASFQEEEEKEPEASSHSMGKEMDIEAIHPSKSIENKKNEGEEMPHDATKDVSISTETASPDKQKEEEATENCTGPNDKTGCPLITTLIDETSSENAGLDVGGKLEGNSSIAFEERSQEAVEPSEKMRSMTFIQDEIQEKSDSESSFVKKMEDMLLQKVGKSETFKEVPETGSDDIVKERENEVKNHNEIIENTVIADSSLSSTYEDDGNPEPKFMKHEESSHREGEELAPEEASKVEYRDEGLSVIVEDNIEAAEHSKSEMSKHRIHPEHSFLPENDPGKEKLENSLDMASEEIQSTASNEHAEINTQVEEQRPIESLEDILDETRKGEAINADDINKKEIPEKKTLSTVYLSEKTESAEVGIPNKEANDLYVTNPQVEVTVQTGGEKLDKVPTSVLDEQIHETDGVPIQENMHVNEAYEASNKLKSNSLDQTANEGKLAGELTSGVREMEVDKLEKVFELDFEGKLRFKDAANNTKEEMQQEEEAINTELQRITTKGDNEKSKTDEDVPVKGGNKICSGEGADRLNFQENENGKNNSEAAASELNDGEQSYEADNETDNNDRDINKEVKDPELEAPENTETTAYDKDTETVRSKAEEDLNSETEASALKKQFLEAELKKASEKLVDVSSTVPEEIEEKIKEEKVEDADICNDKTEATATVVTKETSLGEIQQDDKSVKASDTSPDSETLATIQTTETSLQGEEIASMKLEESSRMVYQPLKIEETSHKTGTSQPAGNTDTNEIEEEIKKYTEAISEPRYNNVEAVTDGEVTSNQTLPAEKLEDETETIKEKIIDGESCTKELPEISGGTVNEVQDSELEAPENLETKDSHKDTETVRSKVEEDLNSETEASAITKPFLEEELKNASEKPVDVSSSVSEEIDAPATVVTKETSLGEIQQDDKSVKASGTSPDSETLAKIQTTETSLQSEEIASMKLEETTQMVYQPPKIEETSHETGTSLPVGNTDTDEAEEEIKKFPEALSEPRHNNVEAVTDGEVTSNQTLPAEKLEAETETIKEKILDGESCTKELHVISGGTVNEVKNPEPEAPENLETTDSNKDADTVRSKDEEDLNSETEASVITKPLLEEELKKASEKPVDVSSSVPEEIEEKIKQEKVEDEDNFIDKSDDAALVVTKETSLGEFQQDDKSVKAFDNSPDSETLATIQTTETSLQDEEIPSIKLEETSGMVYQPLKIEETSHETGTSLPVANTDTDEIEEEIKKYPEAISEPRYNNVEAVTDSEVTYNQTLPVEKLEDETETIKEKIIDGESGTKELHVISGGTVNEVKDPEPEAPENLETTDSNKDADTVRSKDEEDLNSETEASVITKPLLEEELKKASEKPVDVSSSVPEEIEEKIKQEKVEDEDNFIDKSDDAALVVTKETSLGEFQQDDKSVKAFDNSPDSETLATIQTTETGEEIPSIKLEETSGMVYQPLKIEETSHETGTSLPVANTDTDEIEEEIKKYPEAISEPRYNNVEAATDSEVTSNQTLPVEKLEDETETIKEKIIDGESGTKELHVISGGTVNEVKDPEPEAPENLETTDSNKDADTVRSKDEEDLNSETKASVITKPLLEEELKKASEKPVDVSSSVPEEIEEKIKQEKVEDEDNFIDKSDDAALVVTKETSLGEFQQDDKSVKAFDNSPDSETLATIQTTETSLQGEEIPSIKLEETSGMVYQPLKIEETSHETGTSLPVANTDTDEIEEEIKKYPEAISEPRYNNIEAVTDSEVTYNQTLPVEKLEDETETIKEKIIDGESGTKELHVISGGTVNEVKDPEPEAPENLETTDSNKDADTVRSKDEEDLNSETEASVITKPLLEEELKKASEKPVDVSSSVPEEIEEKIKQEKVEDEDNFIDKSDDAALVVTKETSLGEFQQDDKFVKAFDNSPDSETLATIQTTETGEEIPSIKLEETSGMVYQPLKIEETSNETGTSLPVANTDTDEIEEEIKKYPEAISEPRYNNVEEVTDSEVNSNQTLPVEKLEDKTETIKEKIIEGESCTKELHVISCGTVNEVKDPEPEAPENLETTDSNKDTETVRSKAEEDLNSETEASVLTKQFLEEELKTSENRADVSSSVPEEIEDKIKEERVEDADNSNNKTDAAATVVTKETSLGEIQQDDKSVKASDTSPDSETLAAIQTTETILQGEEIASMKLEETSQETGTSLPVGNTGTNEIEEEIKKVPEAIEKALDELEAGSYSHGSGASGTRSISTSTEEVSAEVDRAEENENIKEQKIEGESCTKELHMISGGTVNEVKNPELEAPENLETTDSNKDTETVRSKAEEDLNSETEASVLTKQFLEEELKTSENRADVSSSVPEEIEDKIKEERVEDADNSNDKTDAAATVVTKETSLGEIQQDDKSVKASDTSPDSETLAAIQTTETILQGEEIASMKLEETSQETGTSLPVGNTGTNEIEEEIKKVPEAIEKALDELEAGSYSHGSEASGTRSISTSTEEVSAEVDRAEENENIKEKKIKGVSCTKELHMISDGTVNEIKDLELEAPENPETTDTNKDTETVRSKTEKDLNLETEASALIQQLLEEELKKASEKPADVSSSVAEEIEEKSKAEKVEDADNCNDKTNAAATLEISLGEIQQDDKSVKASDTSPDSETLATIQTTETSLQGEEIASMKLEESSRMVYQPLKIEETARETGTSLPVGNIDTGEIEEEIKKYPEEISEPRYNNVEAVTDGEVTSNQTLPVEKLEDETETIKAKIIDGESCTKELPEISGGTVNEVQDPELEAPENLETTDSNNDTETVRSKVKEDLNLETEVSAITKPFLEEELKKASEKPGDVLSSVSEEIDAAATVVTKETSLGEIQQDDKSVKASGTSPDSETLATIQTTETSLQGEEIASMKLEEITQMVYQPPKMEETFHETGTSLTVGNTDTDEIEEEIKKFPEGISEPRYDNVEAVTEVTSNQTLLAEKLEDKTETIKENFIDGESCTKELHVISGGTVNEIEETSHATGTSPPVGKKGTDEIEEEIKKIPEAISEPGYNNVEAVTDGEVTSNQTLPADKLEDETETIKENIIDGESCTKELHVISGGTVNEVKDPDLEAPENLETTDSNKDIKTVRSKVEENLNSETEASAITKPFLEEELKKASEKPVDVSSSVSEEIDAAATVITIETSLGEVQQDDNSVKTSDTSPDSETLAAIQTTETSLQGEEIASMKLEETSRMVYQPPKIEETSQETGTSLPVGNTDTDEIEEEIKKVPEAIERALDELEAGSYSHGSEASGTRSISTSTEEVSAEVARAEENENIQEQKIEGESCTKELHIISGGTVNEVKNPELEAPENLETTDSNKDTETVRSKAEEDLNSETEASVLTKPFLEEELKKASENRADVSNSVPEEIEEKIKEKRVEDADNCNDKTDAAATVVTKETSLGEIQQDDKSVKASDTSPDSETLAAIQTTETILQGEEIASMKLEETSQETGTSLPVGNICTNEIEEEIKKVPEAVEKALDELEAGSYSHGSEASGTRSISTSTEEVSAEVARAEENENIQEQKIEGESCTKELHIISGGTVNEVKNPELEAPENLETTDSNKDTETVRSKAEEDLNSETEASVLTKPFLEEELKKASENRADVSNSVPEEIEEKIKEKRVEDADNCNDKTDAAATVVTKETSLGEIQQDDKSVKASVTSPDSETLAAIQTTETILQGEEIANMKLEEISQMVYQLPKIEHENAENESTDLKNSEAGEVEKAKNLDAVSESEDQCVEETREIGTSLTVGRIDINETEEEIKKVPETVSEPRYNSIEEGIDGEISNQTLPAEKLEEQLQVPSCVLLFKEQDLDKITTIEKTEDGGTKIKETELDSMKLEETSAMESQLLTIEHENADQFSVTVEKSDADEIKLEQTKILDSVSESKVQSCEEIHETGRSLTMEKIGADDTEEEIKEVRATISGTRHQGVESVTNDEMTPDQTLPAENLEEQLQGPSSASLYKEQERETTTIIEKIEDDSTKKDETEVDSIIIEETSGMVSQLPTMDMSATVEKLDAGEMKIEETKTSDAVCESRDRGVEDIYETRTITVEKNDADKMVEEIKEVPETISEPRYQGVETVSHSEITPDQTLPAGEMDEQLLVPSSVLLPKEQEHETTATMKIEDESTKKDEAEIGNMKLEESSAMASQLPKIDREIADNMNVTVESSDADDVEAEVTKISIAAYDSKDRGVEEIHEPETSLTVGKTDTDKIEEIKEVPEIISGPKYQGVEAVTEVGITPEQTLPARKSEQQLQEPSSVFLFKERDHETPTTIEKIKDESTKKDHTQVNEDLDSSLATGTMEETCLQKEKPRELGVSELELKLIEETKKDSPNEAQKEESTALEEVPAVEPQVYVSEIINADLPSDSEKRYIQCSSQETLKGEDILDSENPNKEADDLASSHSIVKEILPGEVVEKCEEASNLKFEKTGKVLELVSEVHSPEVLTKPEEMKIMEEPLGAAIGELRTKDNQNEEITQANETIKNELSSKKIKEESNVAKNSSVMSSDEEIVTRSNQEDELREEECSGEKTNEKNEITTKGISNKEFAELERTGVNINVEEKIMGEDIAVENTCQVADGNGTANDNLLEEAEEGKNAKRAHTDLDLKDQDDETKCRDIAAEGTALSQEVNRTEVVLVKPNEDRIGASDKEIVIRKDEELQNSNLDDLPVTGTAAEEAPDERVGEKIEEVSELAPREPTYKIIKTDEENKETAMANTNNSESIMDDERPQRTSLELACSESDVIEGLNLKEQEIYANEQSTLSHTDTSQKEMEDKEREKILDEKQHDLKFDEQKTDEVSIGGGKNITCEGEHKHEEEPVKLSTRGNESKLDEAEVHNTITAIEGESQVQNEEMRLNVLAEIKDSIMTISQEDGIVDLAEDHETTKDTQELKKTTLALSDQHSPRESDSNEGTEATISIGNKDVTPVQQDPTAKTFQNAEEEDLKAENASGAEPEEKRMGDECEEKTEKSTSIESAKISLSNLLQGTTKETSQVAKHLTEERELVVNKEELQTENTEIARVEAAKTEDERNEEVGGEEHKREDLGPDAPVMVEASRDVDVKIVNKKSHSLLSGVGSKVKHSIAKVKKVITGKASQCSHPKTESHHW